MVRTPPTALAGKAGLYKRGMTWNLCGWGTQLLPGPPAGGPRLDSPSCGMDGPAISGLEERLRRIFPKTTRGEWAAGALLAILLPAGTLALTFSVLWLLGRFILGFASFGGFLGVAGAGCTGTGEGK